MEFPGEEVPLTELPAVREDVPVVVVHTEAEDQQMPAVKGREVQVVAVPADEFGQSIHRLLDRDFEVRSHRVDRQSRVGDGGQFPLRLVEGGEQPRLFQVGEVGVVVPLPREKRVEREELFRVPAGAEAAVGEVDVVLFDEGQDVIFRRRPVPSFPLPAGKPGRGRHPFQQDPSENIAVEEVEGAAPESALRDLPSGPAVQDCHGYSTRSRTASTMASTPKMAYQMPPGFLTLMFRTKSRPMTAMTPATTKGAAFSAMLWTMIHARGRTSAI